MKKLIIASIILLSGCNTETVKHYDCGSESFDISASEMISDKGVVIERHNKDGRYKLNTALGSAFYHVDSNQIKVAVGSYSVTLTCEVTEK